MSELRPQWNSTLKRRAPAWKPRPLRQDGPRKPPKARKAALPKIGKRGREWAAAWREIKPRMERAGITSCELRREGCQGAFILDPVHSLKRRNCVTPELLREVVLGCRHCHNAIEILPEVEMCRIVRAVIASRAVAI